MAVIARDNIIVELQAKTDQFNKDLEKSGTNVTGFASLAKKAVGVVGAAIAGLALGQFIIDSGKAGDVQLQAEAKLLNALKGRVEVQKALIRQAAEIQERTKIGDEVTVELQSYLAAQGRTEAQIKKTIEATIQLSAVTGNDLKTTLIQLDATFEGNVGRLGKLDGDFKKLTATELQNGAAVDLVVQKYKGFAETAAQIGLGPVEQFKNSIGDIQENIGVFLLSFINPVAKGLASMAAGLNNLIFPTKTAAEETQGLQIAFNNEVEALKKANLSQEQRSKLITQINTKYVDYLPKLITERDSLKEINAIQEQANANFLKRITFLAIEDQLRQNQNNLIKAQGEELKLVVLQEDLLRKQRERDLALQSGATSASREVQGIDAEFAAIQRNIFLAEGRLGRNREVQKRLAKEAQEIIALAQKNGIDLASLLNDATGGGISGGASTLTNKAVEAGTKLLRSLQDQFALAISKDKDRTQLLLARRDLIESVTGTPEQIEQQLKLIYAIFENALNKLNGPKPSNKAIPPILRDVFATPETIKSISEDQNKAIEDAFERIKRLADKELDKILDDRDLKKSTFLGRFFPGLVSGLSGEETAALELAGQQLLTFARNLTVQLIDEEVRRKDEQIDIARQRVEDFRSIAEKGGAEQLQLEEQRLAKLNEERERAAQKGRVIAALEIATANAVSTATAIQAVISGFSKGGNIALGIANAIAIAATVGSIILATQSATSQIPAYKDGTPYLNGAGDGRSDSILVRASKGERITDAKTNEPWKNVSNKELFQLARIGVDTVKGGSSAKLEEKMDALNKSIKEIQIFMHVDQLGLAAGIDQVNNHKQKVKRMRG